MVNTFKKYFKQPFIAGHQGKFAVAASGGLDSTVLCALCNEIQLNFIIVHCNFQLRGSESTRDEEFVKKLAHKYNVEFIIKKFDTNQFAEEKKMGIQEAARELRYKWFAELHATKIVSFTLLAHHANDNIETLLMNFLRGSGLHGLTAMDDFQELGYCLRPLLLFKREELLNYAHKKKLEWVEDSSNQSLKYTRNFIRNEIIPQIKTVFPKVEDNLLKSIQRYKSTESLFKSLINDYKNKLIEIMPDGSRRVPVLKIKNNINLTLIYELIKEYGFTEKQVFEVEKLLESQSGKFIENEHFRIIKHRNWLIFSNVKNGSDIIPISKEMKSINFNGSFVLRIGFKQGFPLSFSNVSNKVYLDADLIEWPLTLRKWKAGDYFYPLGMKKKKKLARFFIDKKLSKDEKDNIWLLESNKRIIWILGHQIDDRFKITDSTKKSILFNFNDH